MQKGRDTSDELLIAAVWTGFDTAAQLAIEMAEKFEAAGAQITAEHLTELFTRTRSDVLASGLVEQIFGEEQP
jgi:hypothetical protein